MVKKLDARRILRLLPWAAGLASLLFLLYSMDVISKSIGFYWDELWDYVPSVAMIRGDSMQGSQEIRLFHHPVPLVSGPYQGALKVWVAAPLIKLFGTLPHRILTINVLFGMIYLLALYWALLPAIGRWSWLVFASPFLDTNFLLVAPMDYGPSLFQYTFISLAMGALFRYLADSDMKYYRLIWFFTGCILAQKLTAIPIVISLIAITIVISCRAFWRTAVNHQLRAAAKSYVIIPSLLFLIPMIPHFLYFWRSGLRDLLTMTADGARFPYFGSLMDNFKYFSTMFDGSDWCQRITLDYSTPAKLPPVLFVFVLVVMAASLVIYFTSGSEKRHCMPAIVSIALLLGNFLIYPVFRGLYRPWHFFVLTPLFACCGILSCANCLSYLANRWRKFAVYIQCVVALFLTLCVTFGAARGFEVLRWIESRKGVCLTSPAITEAYEALKAANVKMIYGLSYSIAQPIYVLSKGTIRVEELGFTDLTKEKIDELLKNVRENSEAAIVYRFCGCKEGDPNWIRWLNRDPPIVEFIRRVDSEHSSLDIKTIRDGRKTDFVLIRKSRKHPG